MEIRTGAEIAREVYPYKDTKGRTVYLVPNRARHYLTKCVAADELAKELEEQMKAIVDFIDAVDRLSKFEEIPDEALESFQTEEIEVSYTLEKIDELIEKLREGTK